MTKEQLWEIYQQKNPTFNNKEITLTKSGLRHLVFRTWELAQQENPINKGEDIFNTLFKTPPNYRNIRK